MPVYTVAESGEDTQAIVATLRKNRPTSDLVWWTAAAVVTCLLVAAFEYMTSHKTRLATGLFLVAVAAAIVVWLGLLGHGRMRRLYVENRVIRRRLVSLGADVAELRADPRAAEQQLARMQMVLLAAIAKRDPQLAELAEAVGEVRKLARASYTNGFVEGVMRRTPDDPGDLAPGQ
jgi:hypothetical protein